MSISAGPRTLVAKTCKVCGELKMAKCFAKVYKVYRTHICHTCKNNQSRPLMHAHQEKALTAAVKHRQPWCEAEIEKLEEMLEAGLHAPQIALALNRTVYAVYTKVHKLKEQA